MDPFELEKNQIRRHLKRKLKLSLTYKNKCSNQLGLALSWPQLEHETQLLQAHFHLFKKGVPTLKVKDWNQENQYIEIALDPAKDLKDQIAERYRQCKKYRKGIGHLEAQLAKADGQIKDLEEKLARLEIAATSEELPVIEAAPKLSKEVQAEVKALPFREFKSHAGLKIWVGKSAKHNDVLTFKHAHGSDYWMHVQGMPGSHVVLKAGKGAEPDHESLLDAMHLALFFSKAKQQGEGEVLVTQRKYVSKGSGKTGQVQVSKHKNYHIRLDADRIKRIKQI